MMPIPAMVSLLRNAPSIIAPTDLLAIALRRGFFWVLSFVRAMARLIIWEEVDPVPSKILLHLSFQISHNICPLSSTLEPAYNLMAENICYKQSNLRYLWV
ncbi:hypothetical protein IHE45_05G074300 [Dioscorea alata]|uniref:Uncharacterized protein n=1 Tax=Dioscorea alata TaxID=55571 RepID=A0ACB7W224_DIOAL|nr:hypothetical protein IHE45_05G074300 [Dioscorea alata]